jgi:hypothetical protein
VSSTSARHRKPSRFPTSTPASASASARHRKRTLTASLLGGGPALIAAVAGTTLILGAGAAFAVTSWPAQAPHSNLSREDAANDDEAGMRASNLTDGTQDHDGPLAASAVRPSARPGTKQSRLQAPAVKSVIKRHKARAVAAAPPVYRNPLRDISDLLPERDDMGADFGGSGPIYALGKAVITNAVGDSAGWPGGGWITYRLSSGPAAGLQVYVAEDVRPTVQVGQHVTSSTVIADMYNGGDGIETGWAMPNGVSAESQLPVAGGISGGGPFPTRVGLSFDSLLVTLGVPPAPNFGQAGFGILPSNYPTSWASVRPKS